MEENSAISAERGLRTTRTQQPKWQIATLVVGLLMGACLGPGVFMLLAYFEPKGETLLSIAVGALVAFAISLVLATVVTLVILPRLLSNVRGTLTAVVEDLTLASRAHAQGQPDAALVHFGMAAQEGAAWYSANNARQFAMKAALGLLISFGGIVGAVLLLRQNSLLQVQNSLLSDQNKKIDKQLDLLIDQNEKLDKQTDVADAQKRGAFVTELFSIVQEVANHVGTNGVGNGQLPLPLATRIAVLTQSATPYRYLNQRDDKRRSIPVALSPERGQLAVALTRMKISLAALSRQGAFFTHSDLRGFDLTSADFSGTHLENCDFSFSQLSGVNFKNAILEWAIFNDVVGENVSFKDAIFLEMKIERARFYRANFDGASISGLTIKDSELSLSSFESAEWSKLAFENVRIEKNNERLTKPSELPKGIPWSPELEKEFTVAKERATAGNRYFHFSFEAPENIPKDQPRALPLLPR